MCRCYLSKAIWKHISYSEVMAVGLAADAKRSHPGRGRTFYHRSPAYISFSTNTLAERIYLLQIFSSRWKMIFCVLCWKEKSPLSDSLSKQQKSENSALHPASWGVSLTACCMHVNKEATSASWQSEALSTSAVTMYPDRHSAYGSGFVLLCYWKEQVKQVKHIRDCILCCLSVYRANPSWHLTWP